MLLESIDANTLKTWLDSGEAVLVDVRDQGKYGAQRIPGAFHLPLDRQVELRNQSCKTPTQNFCMTK